MLPAPRDPHAHEAVPPDPPPDPPPLAPQLTALLRSAGAQALHAVDGESGEMLAEAGLAAGDDVPALAQLTRAAKALGRGRGEWLEDLVVTLGRTVHVLRECDGVVLHARLDPASGDVGAVRRGLASPEVRRAADAAGRAAAPTAPPGDGAGAPAPALPPPRGTHRREPRPPAGPRPAAAAAPASRPRPAAETGWPYSVAEPPPATPPATSPPVPPPPAPPPGRRPAHSAEARRAAEPAERPGDDGAGPEPDALATAPSLRPVPPQPRRVPARPLPSVPAQARPHPISRPTPLLSMQPVPKPDPQPSPPRSVRPSPTPRSGRVQEPPRVPLPRPAGGPAPAGRDPALVTVDGGMPLTGSGALAVLALPSAALPHRRRVAPARPAPSPHGFVTPPVLRQPWASDVPTMRRMLAGLHRMN